LMMSIPFPLPVICRHGNTCNKADPSLSAGATINVAEVAKEILNQHESRPSDKKSSSVGKFHSQRLLSGPMHGGHDCLLVTVHQK